MNRDRLRALIGEFRKRGIVRVGEDPAEVVARKIARIEADTFPEQLRLMRDVAKRLVVALGRRGAKTTGILRRYLVRMLRKPGYRVPWLSTTKDDARAIVGPPLREMDALYELGIRFQSDGFWTLPNGSWFRLGGLGDIKQVQKPRGLGYDAIVVDEVQSIRVDLEEFIDSVAQPALMDRNGDLVLTGTPDEKRRNRIWSSAIRGEGKFSHYSRHWWPITANRFIDAASYLRQMLEEEGYSEDDPRFRAEFMGDVNAFDSVNLMVRDYVEARNWVREPPPGKMHFVLGYDIGLVDRAAWVLFGYSFVDRRVYLLGSFARSGMDITEQGAMLYALAEDFPYLEIVADEGALGKLIVLELSNRFPGLSFTAAEKTEKALQVKLLNTDLRTGRLLVSGPPHMHIGKGARRPGREMAETPEDLRIVEQWGSTIWNEDHSREQEGQEVDLFDAGLYGWRACKTYLDQKAPPPVVDEWERKITDHDRGKQVWLFQRK